MLFLKDKKQLSSRGHCCWDCVKSFRILVETNIEKNIATVMCMNKKIFGCVSWYFAWISWLLGSGLTGIMTADVGVGFSC